MKRPKLRKASKRVSCHKRYKIQKKVREHKRKIRKGAVKAGHRKPKRDLSIPNNAPFKEDILREAELRKQRREELKAAQKLERQKEVAKKRKLKDKTEKPKEQQKDKTEKLKAKLKAKKEKENAKKLKKAADKSSMKHFCMEVNKVIKASDVVLEVLDARDPLGTRCPQAEQSVLQSPEKKLLLVLNKIDLVPKDITSKWLHILNKEIPTIAFKSSTQVQEKNLPSNGPNVRPGCIDISKGTVCYGADSLLRTLHRLCPTPNQGIKVGLIGFSNVGKSSLINSFKQFRVCSVGSLRGTTRFMQEVNIAENIKMVDSPSLVASPDNPPVTLMMRKVFQKEGDDVLNDVKLVIKHCDKRQIILQYNIPDFRNSLEFLDLLARKRSLTKKGGAPDLKAAAILFLDDWMGARLNYYTQPPASFSSHISDEQTAAMCKCVNLNALNANNKKMIKALRCPSTSSSIPFQFSHMTNGVIDETELKEENPEAEEQDIEEDDVEEEDAENNEEVKEDEDNVEKENPKLKLISSGENTAAPAKEPACKSVRFDKIEDEFDDAYDFSTDFH